jgi:hypothetical protein
MFPYLPSDTKRICLAENIDNSKKKKNAARKPKTMSAFRQREATAPRANPII